MFRTNNLLSCPNKFLIKQINKEFEKYTTCAKHLINFCTKHPLSKWSFQLNETQQIQQQHPRYLSNTTTRNNNHVPVDERKRVKNVIEKIYVGPLAQRMRVVKVFSLTTSLVGLAVQPVLLERGVELGGAPLAIFFCSFGAVFTFLTPLLLHFITKSYVTEMHYNNERDEYIATTVSILLQKIHTKFHPNDAKIPEVPGIFTSFVAQGKPFFVDPSVFHNTDHYIRIMGYDKPIDYKFKESAAAETKSSSKNIAETKC